MLKWGVALRCASWIALSLGAAVGALGCNATCIRDSDCLGRSVCSENRCLLIVRRDAGTSNTPSDTNEGSGGSAGTSDSGAAPAAADAGD